MITLAPKRTILTRVKYSDATAKDPPALHQRHLGALDRFSSTSRDAAPTGTKTSTAPERVENPRDEYGEEQSIRRGNSKSSVSSVML